MMPLSNVENERVDFVEDVTIDKSSEYNVPITSPGEIRLFSVPSKDSKDLLSFSFNANFGN